MPAVPHDLLAGQLGGWRYQRRQCGHFGYSSGQR
jgi:hypothetical protein